jgi:hypothetical protein
VPDADAPAAAHDHTLALATFLLLAVWGFMTFTYGALDLVGSVRNWWSFQHAGAAVPFPGDRMMGLDIVLMLGWVLSLNFVPVALVLGIVQIARVHRSEWRCLAFAAVVLSGVAGAIGFNQLRNSDDPGLAMSLWSWDVLGALGYSTIVGIVLALSWLLMRPTPRPT